MRLRDITITAMLAVGLLAPAPVASAAGGTAPAPSPAAGIPETVSAHLDGFERAPGLRAASSGIGELSSPAKASIPFSMIGLELPVDASARVRTSTDGLTWGAWVETDHMESDDGPDRDSAEDRAIVTDTERFTEPLWVDEARWVQVEVEGAPLGDVAATFIDSNGLSSPTRLPVETPDESAGYSAAAFARPAITSRAQWGADESYRSGSPSVASGGVKYAVVHHTAGGNVYSPADGPAVVRGIYKYHTQSLGWSDVGYNVLIDRYGRIYEGRAGGLDKAVVGAHAQGFNTGSVGVSVMGNFEGVNVPQAALDAVSDVLAWKFSANRIDPKGTISVRSGGSNKFPSGQSVTLSTITAHRNVGQTACPGANFYAKMPTLRDLVLWRVVASGSAATPTPTPTPTPVSDLGGFSDIAGSTHAANIVKLVEANVTEGCAPGLFCPMVNLTRGQAAAMLVRAMPELQLATGQLYADVPRDHVFAPHIWMASQAGLINGYADGTFRPSAPMTREQMATVLGRAAGLSRRPGQYFDDVPWVSPHLAWVNAIGEAGISKGCGGGNFCPAATVTRQEMASFVARALLD